MLHYVTDRYSKGPNVAFFEVALNIGRRPMRYCIDFLEHDTRRENTAQKIMEKQTKKK